ncbi:MAG: 50S ribosomal protein L9 [Candidatus Omnitrophica bacterium]|nr:50S ribosomal protein L9 [Candidatus Omnitrophota bacterium]MDD5488202.1 50S ribosomal protein L9 [Candidatus Omnitrophota bacterium]
MKVILIKDVESLGQIGDEMEVKDGYARNYLIPNKFVIEATPGAVSILEQKKRQKERRERKLMEAAGQLAEKIAALSITVSMEAGEEDKLFGAVTSEVIAEYLAAEGIEIDKKKIVLDDPIKALGVYNVEIKLHPEVKAQARVWVVKK